MKKIFAIALVIVMMAAISVPAFAAELTGNAEATLGQTTHITYGVDQTYTVTIPETITIDKTNRTGSGDVTVDKVCIPAGKNIKISVTSATEPTSPNKWELKDSAASGTKAANVGYSITVDSTELSRGDTFLTAASAVSFTAVTKKLNIAVNPTMQVATYEDYLTFSVAIEA